MYYHVKISQKCGWNDEVKLDLSEERLRNQFLTKYENNEEIFVNGKTIPPEDIGIMHINRTKDHSSKIIPIIRARKKAENMITMVPYEWYVTDEGEDVTDDFIQGPPGYKKTKSKESITPKPQSNQIFVVHGHDKEMEEAVARILEKLGLEPIILHEQAGSSKTIIEKFEACSENVSFAIVLLSPDDLGYKKDQSPESAMLRARQNVILELGYFMGKLGRKNVVALHRSETNFEFPSDILGILYISFDKYNGWKLALAKELKAAGYDIDFGKL